MALRIVSVGCFLGVFLQPGASASVAASVRPDGTVEVAQTSEEMPNLLEASLFRRMGVDYDGQLHEVQHRGQVHGSGQRHGNGNSIAVGEERGFSCAEVRAKYDSEEKQQHTTEEVLCLDISRANGTASCCKDEPKDCCKDPDKCTLDDVFSALDMQDLCSKSALVEAVQVDDPRGDEEGDGVADNEAAEVPGDKETVTKLEKGNKGTASIMATIDGMAGLSEQKRQVEQKVEALRDEILKHPRSQVEDSLLDGVFRTDALEELRRGDIFGQSPSRNLLNARSNASKKPLFKGKVPSSLDPYDFQQSVAGGSASFFGQVMQGDPLAAALDTVKDTTLEIAGLINPFLSFFAGLLFSFLGGDTNEAIIEFIFNHVRDEIQLNKAQDLINELKDLSGELQWMPRVLEEVPDGHRVPWFNSVQLHLATKKTNVFHRACLDKAPWTKITRPTLLEANSSFQRRATIGSHGADASPDNAVKPALVEDGTSSNRMIMRTHDAGTSLDQSIQGKRSKPSYDDCQRWNHVEAIVEMQWQFAEVHANVLSTIVALDASYKAGLSLRILDVAHEYAGLIEQSMNAFMDYRLPMIHKKHFCNSGRKRRCRGGRSEGVHDEFLDKNIKYTKWQTYYDGIKNTLNTRKTQRKERLMCFARAAARQNIGTCGHARVR